MTPSPFKYRIVEVRDGVWRIYNDWTMEWAPESFATSMAAWEWLAKKHPDRSIVEVMA